MTQTYNWIVSRLFQKGDVIVVHGPRCDVSTRYIYSAAVIMAKDKKFQNYECLVDNVVFVNEHFHRVSVGAMSHILPQGMAFYARVPTAKEIQELGATVVVIDNFDWLEGMRHGKDAGCNTRELIKKARRLAAATQTVVVLKYPAQLDNGPVSFAIRAYSDLTIKVEPIRNDERGMITEMRASVDKCGYGPWPWETVMPV